MPKFSALPQALGQEKKYLLRHLGGISLEQESTSPPAQLESATSNQTGTISEPLPPRRLPSVNKSADAANTNAGQVALPEELPAPAASIDLSLADARASALTSNLDLAVELVNPEIARQQVSEETARFESTFSSAYELNRVDPPPGVAAGGAPDTTFQRFNNAVTKPLLSGGEVSALHNVTRADFHNAPLSPAVDTDLGLQYSQPLLRGFGYCVNTSQIRIAQTNAAIADAESKLTAIRVLADVERAYWQLYAARQFAIITEQQLALANQQADVARRLVKAEVFTKVEELVAESGVLVRKDAAIRAATNVRLAERDLKRIMQQPDAPVDSSTEILLTTEPNPTGLVFDRRNLAERALANRMEILQLQLQLLATIIDAEFQSNGLLPRLDLRARADALGQNPSYRTSMDNLFGGDFSDNLLALVLEVPLSGNVAARARLRQAQLRGMQTRIQTQQVSVIIVQEVYSAIDRVEQNWQRIIAARQATIASQRAYEGQVKLQDAGRQTVTDVLAALTNLGDSRTQEVQAIVDYQIAKVDLALAAGAMLGYGQVDWSPCCGAQSPLPDSDAALGKAVNSAAPANAELQFSPGMLPGAPNVPGPPVPLQHPPIMLPRES
jgi:outer membrane protein TolC